MILGCRKKLTVPLIAKKLIDMGLFHSHFDFDAFFGLRNAGLFN
jgi:hypothetical protein